MHRIVPTADFLHWQRVPGLTTGLADRTRVRLGLSMTCRPFILMELYIRCYFLFQSCDCRFPYCQWKFSTKNTVQCTYIQPDKALCVICPPHYLMQESTVSPEQPQIPGVWEALQRPTRNRPKSRSLAAFGAIQEVCAPDPSGGGNLSNKFDLLCPREECGSIILKKGVAKWVERASMQVNGFVRDFYSTSHFW